jgi:peptidoglycan/LPS O-acetylase OafA/YrhL
MFCIFKGHSEYQYQIKISKLTPLLESCPMLVKGFSAYTNNMKLFKMTALTPDQLPCLNGLKFLSMMWVVYVHIYRSRKSNSFPNTKYLIEWTNSLYAMFLLNGTLSVDTFFTIGSALMSYGFMKAKCKNIRFNIFRYYLHRYLR